MTRLQKPKGKETPNVHRLLPPGKGWAVIFAVISLSSPSSYGYASRPRPIPIPRPLPRGASESRALILLGGGARESTVISPSDAAWAWD